MSLVADSPVHSSGSDDFAALLDAELDTTSDASVDPEQVAEKKEDSDDGEVDNCDVEFERVKRFKVESYEGTTEPLSSSSEGEPAHGSSPKNVCPHPGVYAGMCMKCGQKLDDESGVAFGYIHKNLRLAKDEISRLRDKDLQSLLNHKKLYLVLDLDHTLLNSARLLDITVEEGYLNGQRDAWPDTLKKDIFKLDSMQMMTKLRPFVHDFLKKVWKKHKENLILMERYHFFASSSKHFGFNCKSLSELRSDESETDGELSAVLKILEQIHNLFFDPERKDNLVDRDVRKVLKTVRKEVLKGCKVVFSRVFPTNFQAEQHHLWKMAEQLGATCSIELDSSVTHMVSMDAGTDKSRWAVQEKKFLVHPRWIEASNYLWKKQPEEDFPVSQTKNI